MLRLATDEDFNNRILRGVLRRNPGLDIIRAQDAGLRGQEDVPIGLAIEEVLLLAECSLEGEWEGQIRFLPLR